MKVLKVIGILLLVIVALGLIASLVLPKEMNVHVEETIEAPIDVVWDHMNSFEKSDKWSAWYDADPDMKVTFAGEQGTVGSSFSWSGEEVGSGTQTLTAIDAENHTMETTVTHDWGGGVNKTTLEDLGDGKVKVTSDYHEDLGIPSNLFTALFDGEGMLTKTETKAFSNLKTLAEEAAKKMPVAVTYEVTTSERDAMTYAGKKEVVKMMDMGTYFPENMPKIGMAAGEMAVGAPSALFWSWDTINMESEMTVAMPIKGDAPEGYETYEQPAGQYISVDYYGDYDGTGAAHGSLWAHIGANNLELNGAMMEEYITDPTTEKDTSKWLTRVVYPVKPAETADAGE